MSIFNTNSRREEVKTKMKEAKAEKKQIELEKARAEIKKQEAKTKIRQQNGGMGIKIILFNKKLSKKKWLKKK